MTYTYDALNRLATVTDAQRRDDLHLRRRRQPGGLRSIPTASSTATPTTRLNRLTDLAVTGRPARRSPATPTPSARPATALSVTEAERPHGRLRLRRPLPPDRRDRSPAIPDGINGAIGYTYDPVGNRLARTSTLAPRAGRRPTPTTPTTALRATPTTPTATRLARTATPTPTTSRTGWSATTMAP